MKLLCRVTPVVIVLLVLAVVGLLDAPSAEAADELFVVNNGNNSVTVYSLPLPQSGCQCCGFPRIQCNTPPLRTLIGPTTGLNNPVSLALDLTHSELFVANPDSNSVTVYGLTASGDTPPPLRTLSGAGTGGREQPVGLALDLTHNELFLTNFPDASVRVYDRGTFALKRTLKGPTTEISGPVGLALDPVGLVFGLTNDLLFVTNPGNGRIPVFSRTASGDAEPLTFLVGFNPQGPVLDFATHELFAPDFAFDLVSVFDLASDVFYSPARAIVGPATGLSNPIALAIRAAPTGSPFRPLSPNINIGPDLGGTGQTAVNVTGSVGAAGGTWIAIYDSTPSDPTTKDTYPSVSLSADVMITAFNNGKGAGLLALYNEGVGKKGLALIVNDAGNTDTLVLSTLDQAGTLGALKSASLAGDINEKQWYRLTMDVVVAGANVTVTGKVFRHTSPSDPDSALGAQVGGTLGTLSFTGPRPSGVDATGEVGIIASAKAAVVNSSVTNFTINGTRIFP
jgi:hypothetical protein